MTQKNINKGNSFEHEVARFMIAEDVIERIDNLLLAAPELFEKDDCYDFGKIYRGDIQIAVRSIVGDDESVVKLYAVEDSGIAFMAESTADDKVSSVFIATGEWAKKFEKLEDSVREARHI